MRQIVLSVVADAPEPVSAAPAPSCSIPEIVASQNRPAHRPDANELMASMIERTDRHSTLRFWLVFCLATACLLAVVGRVALLARSRMATASAESAAQRHAGPGPASNEGEASTPAQGVGANFRALVAVAQGGDAAAQYDVGIRCLQGDGVPVDTAAAADWFRRAAIGKHAGAQYQLAMAYATGSGVPVDWRAAYEWLVVARANGDSRSEDALRTLGPKLSPPDIAQVRFDIGEMYASGTGVQADPVTAYSWYKLAEEAGEQRAQKAEGELAAKMTEHEISIARNRAAKWLEKHYIK